MGEKIFYSKKDYTSLCRVKRGIATRRIIKIIGRPHVVCGLRIWNILYDFEGIYRKGIDRDLINLARNLRSCLGKPTRDIEIVKAAKIQPACDAPISEIATNILRSEGALCVRLWIKDEENQDTEQQFK
jgi:hypothetical protein